MFENFTVKSIFREYRVSFESYETALVREIKKGDILIIDSNVFSLYPNLRQLINENKVFQVIASEQAKSYDQIGKLITQIIEHGFSKPNRLIAIGGGVVQDITAFASSILFRGVEWLFFPTNLLTQCDSCIGSKTSVNCGEYKNQLGGFYPPSQIYIDFAFWTTITEKEKSSGLGEMLHYFFVEGESNLPKLHKEIVARRSQSGGRLIQDVKAAVQHMARMMSQYSQRFEALGIAPASAGIDIDGDGQMGSKALAFAPSGPPLRSRHGRRASTSGHGLAGDLDQGEDHAPHVVVPAFLHSR